MQDEEADETTPDDPALPWVLRQGSLKFKGFGIDDDGRTTLLFHCSTRGSTLKLLVLHMRSVAAVEWVYGYVLVDPSTKEQHTYQGRFGDPDHDQQVEKP